MTPASPAAPDTDAIFAALADPTRRRLLAALGEGPADVETLAAPLPISRPAVSRHLRLLERAGLVRVEAEGTRRRRVAVPDGLRSARAALDRLAAAMEGDFARLDALLADMETDR